MTRNVVVLACIVSGLACSRPAAAQSERAREVLVGTWSHPESDEYSEYLADGTVIMHGPAPEGRAPVTLTGTWRRLDDRRVLLETTVLGTRAALIVTYQPAATSGAYLLIDGKRTPAEALLVNGQDGRQQRWTRCSLVGYSESSGRAPKPGQLPRCRLPR